MAWPFQPLTPAAAENLSDEPTNSFSTLLNQAPIGYESIDTPTLGKMQAGSFAHKWVALIEGCKFVLSDAPESAVQSALDDTDWASATVIPGLFVSMTNEQSIDPDTSFAGAGRCTLRIIDTDRLDTFGTFINRRLSGAETEVTATVDRNDTTINVKSTTGFTSSGEIYMGTECIGYTGKTSTTFTGCTRGKYSPIGCDTSGSGGSRFGGHHRYGVDARYIQRQPLVTQLPRVWIGKRVSLYLHTWDGTNLNSKINAQQVFAGRLVGISDDPETFHTVLEIEHYTREVQNGVIGQDMYSAEIPPGMWIAAGRKFQFTDQKNGTASSADDLDVVASGASGNYQMNEGFYSNSELCEKLNAWLAQAATDTDINGTYSFSSPVNYRGDGLRTVCQWHVADAGTVRVNFALYTPTEVAAFLGLRDLEPGPNGQMVNAMAGGEDKYSNQNHTVAGVACPYTTVVFKPAGPARVAQEFSESIVYDADNERGTFLDQRALLPAALKEFCPAGEEYGLFLLDDKALMVGSYDGAGRFTNCFLAPYQATADNADEALAYIGRRADEPPAPVTLRQVFLLEGTFATIFKTLFYSSGVSGYNHGTYDTLGNGLGLGMPGGLLGPDFDRSVDNLPGADAPLVVVIDEPTKFSELFDADLKIRRAFVRWKDQGFELCQWKTPTLSLATATLEEANKAAPAGAQENHRTASQETDEYQKPSVKIDYARDFAVGRDGKYLKSVSVEDQAGTDSTGNGGTGTRSETLKMRNTFAQFANTGAAIESLIPGYMASTPMFSQSAHRFARTIDLRYFETLSVGDVVEVEDEFARDPVTGRRGIDERAFVVTRISYDLGGPSATGGKPRDMRGEVELMSLDAHRGERYSPSADIDNAATFGGFDAGYNTTTDTIRCKAHAYSHQLTVKTKRGWSFTIVEPRDATNFEEGDEVIVIERDPADPTSPTTWTRTIESVSGDDITFTTGLSSPAWDNTLQYRIISAPYSSAQTSQQDDCYQADEDDLLIEDTDPPYHYAKPDESYGLSGVSGVAELISTSSYGDGVAFDVGTDRALAANFNCHTDYVSCTQQPMMVSGDEVGATDIDGAMSSISATLFIFPVFVGLDILSATITRVLTIAPWFRSGNGSAAEIRVTVTDKLPQPRPAVSEDVPVVGFYGSPMFPGKFSQTSTWTTTSTTWQAGESKDVSLGVKADMGFVYVIIEGAAHAQCRGLTACRVSARRVA